MILGEKCADEFGPNIHAQCSTKTPFGPCDCPCHFDGKEVAA
jgi:hypothetical protein